MPNRNSTACGVSHFIAMLLNKVRLHVPPEPASPNRRHHETGSHDFHERCIGPPAGLAGPGPGWYHAGRMSLRTRLNLVVAALSAAFLIVLIAAEVESARSSVREEIEAANRVASQLLGQPGRGVFRGGRTRPGAAFPAATGPGSRQRGIAADHRRRGAVSLSAGDLQGGPRGAGLVCPSAGARAGEVRISAARRRDCWWCRRSPRAPCSTPGTTSRFSPASPRPCSSS